MSVPAAFLVVRAVVADPADRGRFDDWYRAEHLPDAAKAFNAVSAMRGWSTQDASVHLALYRFASTDAAQAATGGAAIKALITEFDRRWGTRVTRTRDILPVADELEGR